MPTAPNPFPIALGADAPRLDASGPDATARLVSRLRDSNLALDRLRQALEVDEARRDLGPPRSMRAG